MKLIIVVAALLLSGCAVNLAVGPERFRLIELSTMGGDTFCWQGAGYNDIGIRALGWGPSECNWSRMPEE